MNSSSGKAKGYFALSLTSILWGTTWVASKLGIMVMPALQMASIRQLIAGGVFVLFFIFIKKESLPTLRQFRWIFVMSLFMFVFANGLSTWSLKYIPTGLSALVGALYPLSVVLIEMIFYKRKGMSKLTLLGFVLGIFGILIVFSEHIRLELSAYFFLGLGLSLTAMLAWSLGTIFLARNKASMNPYYSTGWQMVVSSVILYFMAFVTEPILPVASIPLKGWLVIFYLVIFGSVITFISFIYSMKKLPVAIASLYAYINPLVAILTAAVILQEKLTFYILWGAIITVAGVFIVNYSLKKEVKKIIDETEV